MKKIILLLVLLLTTSSISYAYDVNLLKEGQYQKKVMQVGFRILNYNRIDKRVVFRYYTNPQANAMAVSSDKSVIMLSGLLPYVESDAELAGILSHEIAHAVDYHHGFWRRLAMSWSGKKYEKKADKKAVDYMVKAGYDPVALIVIMNKFAGQRNSDFLRSHPLTSKRLAYIYQYIYQKYPAYLARNSYRKNIYYQNFLLTSKEAREKIQQDNIVKVSNKKTKKSKKNKKSKNKKAK